jgi:hypothetical protein
MVAIVVGPIEFAGGKHAKFMAMASPHPTVQLNLNLLRCQVCLLAQWLAFSLNFHFCNVM